MCVKGAIHIIIYIIITVTIIVIIIIIIIIIIRSLWRQDSDVCVVLCATTVLLSTRLGIESDSVLTSWLNSGSAQVNRTLSWHRGWIRVSDSVLTSWLNSGSAQVNRTLSWHRGWIRVLPRWDGLFHYLQTTSSFVVEFGFCPSASDSVLTSWLNSGSAQVGQVVSLPANDIIICLQIMSCSVDHA